PPPGRPGMSPGMPGSRAMADETGTTPDQPPGLIVVTSPEGEKGKASPAEAVEQPAKVMRIGTMIRQLLEEVRLAPLDDAGGARRREHRARRALRGQARPPAPAISDEFGSDEFGSDEFGSDEFGSRQ